MLRRLCIRMTCRSGIERVTRESPRAEARMGIGHLRLSGAASRLLVAIAACVALMDAPCVAAQAPAA
jgi:hypothetical protein